MEDCLQRAAEAIKEGDRTRARQLLKPVLTSDQQSADAWFLAAHAVEREDQKIACLKKALALDEWHPGANRMLSKMQQVESVITREPLVREEDERSRQQLEQYRLEKAGTHVRSQAEKRRDRQRGWRRFGCAMVVVLNLSCALFTFSLIGLFPGFIGTLAELTGGTAPVRQIDGVPIEDIANAAATIQPSQSKDAPSQGVDVLDHGYNHEYTFEAIAGDEVLGYVQFMSVSAADVTRNVIILDPTDQIVQPDECRFLGEEGLLGGQGNTTFECLIQQTGIYRVRILGITGQSVGAYFIGTETLNR